MPKKIKIATRKSELALWQANFVSKQLVDLGFEVELLGIKTGGDLNLEQSLADIGGKGLFIKELEIAILEKKADIAVHSMKDVPIQLPDGFVLPSYLKRDNPSDCLLISKTKPPKNLSTNLINKLEKLDKIDEEFLTKLSPCFRFGTSSLRRSSQILKINPKLKIIPIRGNLNTRIAKLNDGVCDGLVLARAGINRLMASNLNSNLNFNHYFIIDFSHQTILPAIGQGIIGIECASDNLKLIDDLKKLDEPQSRLVLQAERIINQILGGSCSSTLCAYAEIRKDKVKIKARVLAEDGSDCIEVCHLGELNQADELAFFIANELIELGAQKYL